MSNKPFPEQIEDYKESIFAIVGFIHLFRYDDAARAMRDDIEVSQGRRMRTSSSNPISPDNEVTPDFCIQGPANKGVVGEVKKSFPSNDTLWMDDFRQLMSYDDNLVNWLTESGRIDDHNIVLLTHIGRSRALTRYFHGHDGEEIAFTRSFLIVEFARVQEAKPHLHLRTEYGNLKYFDKIDGRLHSGVLVPLEKLMLVYEKVKLYDAEPPLPYLLHLIWEGVVMLRAADDARFLNLRRNSKLPIDMAVNEVVEELHENYSFCPLNAGEGLHQPSIPPRSWIKKAIDALVSFELAKWENEAAGECVIYFKKLKDPLQIFIDLCQEHGFGVEASGEQFQLFRNQTD